VFAALGSPASAAVVISNAATANMACSAGVCTATAADTVLSRKQLLTMLASGNAKVATGTATHIIRVVTGLSWTSANALTLDSSGSIRIDAPVTVTGPGGVSLVTNDGGSGGSLSFAPKGNLTFWDMSSALTINGVAYTLVNNIATMASDANANWSTNLALANNYDASVDGTFSDAPVSVLWGNFEGLGHTMSNLSVASSGFCALFGVAGNVENITLNNVNMVGYGGQLAAGLVAQGGNTISNVTVTGHIDASGSSVAGFIAAMFGGAGSMLSNAHASGQLVAGNGTQVGGLVGQNLIGTISFSSADVEITGGGLAVGGLVGVSTGSVSDSFATGAVSGQGYVGGAIGGNVGSVMRTYATGAVTDSGTGQYADAGGFVGINQPSNPYVAYIGNSYATGTVSGGTNAGGFVGANQSPIKGSYATGNVTGASMMGGFVGDDTSTHSIANSHWDTTTGVANPSQGAGNIANDPGIRGLTTLEFQSGLPKNFNPNVWGENANINGGLPYLLAIPPR